MRRNTDLETTSFLDRWIMPLAVVSSLITLAGSLFLSMYSG